MQETRKGLNDIPPSPYESVMDWVLEEFILSQDLDNISKKGDLKK